MFCCQILIKKSRPTRKHVTVVTLQIRWIRSLLIVFHWTIFVWLWHYFGNIFLPQPWMTQQIPLRSLDKKNIVTLTTTWSLFCPSHKIGKTKSFSEFPTFGFHFPFSYSLDFLPKFATCHVLKEQCLLIEVHNAYWIFSSPPIYSFIDVFALNLTTLQILTCRRRMEVMRLSMQEH
jgi:hypothetical protein